MEQETVTIEGRNAFALWAIERARAIVAEQGGNLAIAARDMDEKAIAETGNALGAAIAEALLEVYDGLIPDDED
ncbi:hypothetical protein [Rhizobium grahamii]|uniref:Uncharacterized protein n=2 Tax=Rhizobium grahamii TaxID=1120045 RepID=S3HUQ2_9HYPH|nr:hypothetical protein [Rhizobium grahamii]EPE96926.1 hypothetical protein RGCCGE502_18380 [Rhizobium grahamii CCGE 502]RDJ03861.1 hypothetical protein B5K06_28520 [Rhizobium grahamii]